LVGLALLLCSFYAYFVCDIALLFCGARLVSAIAAEVMVAFAAFGELMRLEAGVFGGR
jgi:hypothetical protein